MSNDARDLDLPTVELEQIREFIRSLGVDPKRVTSLEVKEGELRITQMVVDERGAAVKAGEARVLTRQEIIFRVRRSFEQTSDG